MTKDFNLVRGPQDGAKIKAHPEVMPQTIFIKSGELIDGFAAWSRKRSNKFSEEYVLDGEKFVHRPINKE